MSTTFQLRALARQFRRAMCVGTFAALALSANLAFAEWKPAASPLMTKWAADVSPDNVHPEYPRPQMVREDWQSLNGLWDYAIADKGEEKPEYQGKILVPFPVESALSGVGKKVNPEDYLWYRRTFNVEGNKDGRWLLHFGAVDWEATVWVNGVELGSHKGGYDPFGFEITSALKKKTGDQHEIIVRVYDPTETGTQARGKQIRNPHGIWYTPITGIWQSVWIEPVPQQHIKSLKIVPDVDAGQIQVAAITTGTEDNASVKVTVLEGDKTVASGTGKPGETIKIDVPNAKLWSPDSPHLYDLKVALSADDKQQDEVDSYFGMRKIALGKDAHGRLRLFLNNEELFQHGLLDQGFFPDGLYTAATEDALRYDLEVTKKLGFNMARKHVKVEPSRWYYLCDKMGILVWQDMPSGERYIQAHEPDIIRSKESADQFETELKSMVLALQNHPSIVMWVPFNEGWGQYDTARISKFVEELDPSRLVNSVSGWSDRNVGHVHDIHHYPSPRIPPLSETRAVVLGEFGGLGLPISGHTWQNEANWGYKSYTTKEDLTAAYVDLIEELRLLIGQGLAAAVYTQTTDVEVEVNGLLTYDRALIKMDEDQVIKANQSLFDAPSKVTQLIPTAHAGVTDWQYVINQPADDWTAIDFNDSEWLKGRTGFGRHGTPGSLIRSEWTTPNIWIRRSFNLQEVPEGDLHIRVHHDEDAHIFLNGTKIAELGGYQSDYQTVKLQPGHRELLRTGKNVLSVHCTQTGGGQYIDVGLFIIPAESK